MQEVQVVAEPLQFWQGEMQSEHVDPLSQYPAMQEVHQVVEREQFWQGEVQAEQVRATRLSHIPAGQEVQDVAVPKQVEHAGAHAMQRPAVRYFPASQERQFVAEDAQVKQLVEQGEQADPVQ